jgi:hypothetical protein
MKKTVVWLVIAGLSIIGFAGAGAGGYHYQRSQHEEEVSTLMSKLVSAEHEAFVQSLEAESLKRKLGAYEAQEPYRAMEAELKEEMQLLKDQVGYYELVSQLLTKAGKPQYEIIPAAPGVQLPDTVVYCPGLPGDYREKDMHLLRVAMELPDEQYPNVSFWGVREAAEAYAAGKFDPERSNGPDNPHPLEGRRLAVLKQTDRGPSLLVYPTPDYYMPIRYGKYVAPDAAVE